MAPVGPHDHVANKVRLRGRRTDAHLSPPQSSVLSLSVAYLHGRPGSRSAGERAPIVLSPLWVFVFRSGLRHYGMDYAFTGPRSCVLPRRLYVSQSPRGPSSALAAPYRLPRSGSRTPLYRLAVWRAVPALWCVLAPAVPRRCVGVTVCPSSSPARPSARPHPRRRRRGAKPPATGHGPCRWKIIYDIAT